MAIGPSYSLKRVVVTYDGIPIEGYADADEVVAFERASDAAELVVGADGFSVVSQSTDRSMTVTITLSQLSPSYRYLAAKAQAQFDAPGPLVTGRFSLRDLSNGDEVTEARAAFLNRPVRNKGRRPGSVDFRIALPNPTERYGTAILGGL